MVSDRDEIVYVVDDDDSVRNAVEMLLVSANYLVKTFSSAKQFLQADIQTNQACLLSDIRLREIDGLQLQRRLCQQGIDIPIIFFTADSSKASRTQAKKAGAIGFLQKPVDDQALLDLIKWALSH